MAWRPPYHPQFPHTTWGSLARWHCGHSLRGGAPSRHAEARRLRPLALEVFFLGTAMLLLLACGTARKRGPFERQNVRDRLDATRRAGNPFEARPRRPSGGRGGRGGTRRPPG